MDTSEDLDPSLVMDPDVSAALAELQRRLGANCSAWANATTNQRDGYLARAGITSWGDAVAYNQARLLLDNGCKQDPSFGQDVVLQPAPADVPMNPALYRTLFPADSTRPDRFVSPADRYRASANGTTRALVYSSVNKPIFTLAPNPNTDTQTYDPNTGEVTDLTKDNEGVSLLGLSGWKLWAAIAAGTVVVVGGTVVAVRAVRKNSRGKKRS